MKHQHVRIVPKCFIATLCVLQTTNILCYDVIDNKENNSAWFQDKIHCMDRFIKVFIDFTLFEILLDILPSPMTIDFPYIRYMILICNYTS